MKIHLLGSLRVLTSESRTLVLTGVCSRLLGLVALRHEAAGAVSRARLAGTLWPEAPEDQARHLLSNALYRLRRLLDSDGGHLDAGPEHVGLREIWLDTSAFRSGLASQRLEDWLAAFELYAGDLLEEEDAAWVHESRAEMLQLYLRALARACTELESRGDVERALLVAHRWTVADPLEEAAHVAAMRLYGRMGRLDAALGQYERLAGLLRSELDAEPLPETQALVDSLRRQRLEAAAAVPPASRRFVGRQKERAALFQRLEELRHSQGSLVLVEGEPGIGKTRLLEEFAEAARWRGLHVVWGRADETQRAPYSPLPEAIAALTAGPRVERIGARLTPLARQLLASFVPGWSLAGARELLHGQLRPDAVGTRTALQRLLQAAAELEPTVLLFDDVHWADLLFWALAPAMAAATEGRPLLVVLSYRGAELRADPELRAGLERLDLQRPPLRLALEGLSPEECAELALALGHPLDASTARHHQRVAGGNPLLLEELLLHKAGRSSTLETLLASRAASLSDEEHQALSAASVLGRQVPHGVWQSMLGSGPPVQGLLHKRFFHETDQGYAFQHDMVRAYLYDHLSPEQHRHWHRRAADALAREHASSAALAWHYEEGECWPEALHHHLRASERSLQLDGFPAAREHCRRAQALLERFDADGATRLRLRLLRLQLDQIEPQASLEQAAVRLESKLVSSSTAHLHYVRYLFTDESRHLEEARRVMLEQASHFQDPRFGTDYLERLPLHQNIARHWQRLREQDRVVWLVRSDVPLGKALVDEDFIEILWSPEDPLEDPEVLRTQGKAGLRRHRLRRLVHQAQARGAAPTHADLARALRISVSTVERDCRVLAKAGEALATRGSPGREPPA